MLKRRGDSIAVGLFAGDMLLTLVALALARWLRTASFAAIDLTGRWLTQTRNRSTFQGLVLLCGQRS
jgi:hypothetical protein